MHKNPPLEVALVSEQGPLQGGDWLLEYGSSLRGKSSPPGGHHCCHPAILLIKATWLWEGFVISTWLNSSTKLVDNSTIYIHLHLSNQSIGTIISTQAHQVHHPIISSHHSYRLWDSQGPDFVSALSIRREERVSYNVNSLNNNKCRRTKACQVTLFQESMVWSLAEKNHSPRPKVSRNRRNIHQNPLTISEVSQINFLLKTCHKTCTVLAKFPKQKKWNIFGFFCQREGGWVSPNPKGFDQKKMRFLAYFAKKGGFIRN